MSNEYAKEYRERNREKLKLYARKFRSEKRSTRDKEKQKKSIEEWTKKHPERRKAHKAVSYALKTGKLKKQNCRECGVAVVQAHHEDYSKPLEVIWLCPKHHYEYDQKLGNRKST